MVYNLDIDDYIGYWGFSKQYVKNELSKMRGKHIDVRVSSPGGSFDDGLDIRQQFIDHGDVTCYLYGFVASAATVLTLGAKRVCMSKYAFYLIHKVSNWVDAWGNMNADQIEKLIDDLKANKLENDKMDLVLAAMYAKKSGKEINDILPILKEGRWLTAQEALDYGFIDEILEDGEKVNFTDKLRNKFNRLDLPCDLPSIPQNHENDAPKFDEESFFTRLAAFFGFKKDSGHDTNVVSKTEGLEKHVDEPSEKSGVTTPTDQTQISSDMKKNFVKVNALLNVEGIEFAEDGSCTLTEEQLTAINSELGRLDTENGEKANQITELTTQVENLKKGDGAETKHVEGEEEKDDAFQDIEDAQKLFNQFKDFI